MRAVVQRVSRARVTVAGREVGAIGPGLCVLLGAGPEDTPATAIRLAQRVATLRVFDDGTGKMNLDAGAAQGEVLVVSQFTLYADTSRGHRPSFIGAAPPAEAERLYIVFADALRAQGLKVATGEFGARMDVELVNQGPVTIALTSGEGEWAADAG